MQAPENRNFNSSRQIIEAWFSAFSQGDTTHLASLLTDDVVWHVDGDPIVSTVGLLQGRDNVLRWLACFPENFRAREFVVSNYYGDTETVLAVGRFRHTILSTGQTVGSDMVIRFSLRDNRICRYQIFEDSALLKEAFTPQTMPVHRQVRINGTVYRYLDEGEGPVLLFAHGLFLDGQVFGEQRKVLSRTHRCIVIDMPGHGGSGFPPAGWTLDQITEDLALMIKEVIQAPVTFIGQSQGGMTGIRLAARFPALVTRMILIGTSARPEPLQRLADWQQRRKILATGTRQQREQLFADLQQSLNSKHWLQQNPEQAAREHQLMVQQDPQAMALAVSAAVLNRGDSRPLLENIRMPVLVLCGEEDPATPPELSKEIADALVLGKLSIIAATGHHPMLESAAVVTRSIQQFLNDA